MFNRIAPGTPPRSSAPARTGPVPPSERALAPDLARGAMLLFIALANAAGVALGGPGFVRNPTGLERVASVLMLTFVHARAYPVFAVMFGYGLVQLARRQTAAGAAADQVRRVLVRRNAALVVFGFLHATLLYFGDFLAAYGLVGLFATLVLLRRTERVHRIVLWCWGISVLYVVVLAAFVTYQWRWGSSGVPPELTGSVPSLVTASYLHSIRARLIEWPRHTLTVLPFVMIVWLGIWGGRHRLLEDPAQSRLLKTLAIGALGIAIAGGLPFAMAGAGFLRVDVAVAMPIFLLHQVSGMFAGPGYVALFGLAAFAVPRTGLSGWGRLTVDAIATLGQRSLSAYLCQSLAWLLILAPFTLALGGRFSSPMLTGLVTAAVVWLLSVIAASYLRRRGCSGPAEAVLRRLTYGAQ